MMNSNVNRPREETSFSLTSERLTNEVKQSVSPMAMSQGLQCTPHNRNSFLVHPVTLFIYHKPGCMLAEAPK